MSTAAPNKRPAPVDIQQQVAEARKRAAEVKARLEAEKATKTLSNGTNRAINGVNGHASPAVTPAPVQKTAAELARERVEALKARVAAATARAKGDEPPPRPAAESMPFGVQTPEAEDPSRLVGGMGRGGLSIGIHPALLDNAPDRSRTPNYQKARGRSKYDEKVNPYISETGTAGGRAKRTLHFNHNLHSRPAMQAANEMRRKEQVEQMKRKIQAHASKAGLEESTEIKAFEVPMPPDVEFWDESLQAGIDENDFITKLIVHPILIEPPQEKFITLKPAALKLTKKEQKKMRRIRRAEEHREEQAKIRLGLVPTPAPKIKHSNVMNVYGDLAVKDPTAVEAMVNKQIAERRDKHLAANTERQLTKEQRKEKNLQKAKENAAMGLTMCVYRIAYGKDKLHNKHRYLMNVNAQELHDMTGCVLVGPTFSLALIECGEHSTRKYRKLMLNRIKWKAILEGNGQVQNAEEQDEDSQDTTCTLIWQGDMRERKFKKWGSIRDVESDTQAKEALKRFKLDSFWTLAKSAN